MRQKRLILGLCAVLCVGLVGSLGLLGSSARAGTASFQNLTVKLTGEGALIGHPPFTPSSPFAARLCSESDPNNCGGCGVTDRANCGACGVIDDRAYDNAETSFTGTGMVYCRQYIPGRPTYGDITFTITKGTASPSSGGPPQTTTEKVKVTGGDGYFKGATGTGTETATLITSSPAFYTVQWTLTVRVQRVTLA